MALPAQGALGNIRIDIAIFNCHLALVLWPCAYLLFRILLRQRRWLERRKIVALMALSLWTAWSATEIVVWFWPWLLHWLAHLYKG